MKKHLSLLPLLILMFIAGCALATHSVKPPANIPHRLGAMGDFFCPSTNTWLPAGSACGGSVSLPTTQVSAASYAGADWCAKVQAADAAIGANPGIIVVPSTVAGTCAGTLTFAYNGLTASRVIIFDLGTFTGAIATLPNDGTSKQASFRFTGQLSSANNLNIVPIDSTVLNLTNNATNGKIDTRAFGSLEIDHLVLEDTGTDCANYVFDTGIQLKLHDVFAHNEHTSSWCNDGIVFGGTGTTGNDLTATSFFGGYGTIVRDATFTGFKQVFLLQHAANSITFSGIEITGDGDSTGAPIELNGASVSGQGTTRGNTFVVITEELQNYKYGVLNIGGTGALEYGNTFNIGMWDEVPATFSQFYNLSNLGLSGGTASGQLPDEVSGEIDDVGGSTPLGATKTVAGICTMSASTTCTVTLPIWVSTANNCTAVMRGTATPIAGSCHNGATDVTGGDGRLYTQQVIVNAASSNSNSWSVIVR